MAFKLAILGFVGLLGTNSLQLTHEGKDPKTIFYVY
jgi:hypothetical protein